MCCVVGGICVISADYLAVPEATTQRQIGVLPNSLKPLGHTGVNETKDTDTAYIAPLRHRGDNSWYGQLMVTNSGKITVWVSNADSDGYYYGILVFPVRRS